MISMCAFSAWRNGALRRRAKAWCASFPTIPGSTGCRLRGCGSAIWRTFDAIRIDCLNGDKYKTGKVAPDGSPDPSIFSSPDDPVGIQVGTAIATLVRKLDHAPTGEVGFRHLWGQAKREELIETEEAEPGKLYDDIEPVLPLGLPFAQTAVSEGWFDWPALPDLFPVRFHGVRDQPRCFSRRC